MDRKRLSIIVPVYNVEKYIDRCIESIVPYQGKDIEIILVDDGSTDRSRVICQAWEERDGRIILTPKKENGGLADARNYGMTFSKGEWILFIDSDDYLEDGALSLLIENVSCIEDGENVIVFDYYNIPNKKKEKMVGFGLEDEIISGEDAGKRMLNDEIPTSAWSKLVKRSVYTDNHISFPKGRRYEDTIVTWRVFQNVEKIKVMHNTLYNYVQQSDSITANPIVKDAKDTMQNLREIQEDILPTSLCETMFHNYCCRALVYAYQMCVSAEVPDRKVEKEVRQMFEQHYRKADSAWIKKQNDCLKILLMHYGGLKSAIRIKRSFLCNLKREY